MDERVQDGYVRLVNEALGSMAPVSRDDLPGIEQRDMAVDYAITDSFNTGITGCSNDCWLRAVVKRDDHWPRVNAGPEESRTEVGSSFKLYCLPDGIMAPLPPELQAEKCAERHAATRSEFDHYVALESNPVD